MARPIDLHQLRPFARLRASPEDVAASVEDLDGALSSSGLSGLATFHRAIAAFLNARGVRTRQGAKWHVPNVGNLLARGRMS